jgi:dUTP pyrophosphatase
MMSLGNLEDLDLSEYAKKLQQMIDESNNGELDYDMIMNDFGLDMKGLEDDLKNYNPKLPLGFVKLHPDAVTPKYNYETDSGFDLHSVEEVTIPSFGRALVPTGISFDIKDGYEIQVRTKSGLAINQGLMILNSPGTVDNGYTGEVKGIIFNTNNHPVTITKGMKIGQAVLCPVVNGKWVELVEKNKINSKDRGDKGFGSTGI